MGGEERGQATMGTTTTMKRSATNRRLLAGLTAGMALLAFSETAEAQEILLTGPLAGAPAVRNLRLHREGRIEVAPAISFTLLDEFQREILVGARLNYNITEWLAVGAWGGAAFGPLHRPTALSGEIQEVNQTRRNNNNLAAADPNSTILSETNDDIDLLLTNVNLGGNFEDQLAQIDWVAAPQVTITPFRGKIALFKSIYLDTDLYFFAGAGFIGLKERADCDNQGTACTTSNDQSFERVSRMAIAPTFGLGMTFYANEWSAVGAEWRALPYSWNTGGFDTAGGGQDAGFPDGRISSADRKFSFNQMITVSYNIYFPFDQEVSE